MYFVTSEETVVPCRYDQGRDLFVVDKRDHDMEDDYMILSWDGEDYAIYSFDIVEETRRVYFLEVILEEDEDEDEYSDDASDSDEHYSEDSADSLSDDPGESGADTSEDGTTEFNPDEGSPAWFALNYQ